MQNSTPAYMKGWDVRTDVIHTDDFLRTQISWNHSLPHFPTHGAPIRALRARAPLLSSPRGGLFISSPFEGGGGLIEMGGLFERGREA